MEKAAIDYFSYGKRIQKYIQSYWLSSFQAITLFGIFVPFLPMMPHPGLDPAWEFGINQATAQFLAFGQDIIFTFGPYASVLTTQYHPATDALMLLGSSILAISYMAALLIISKDTEWRISLGLTLCIVLFAFSREALVNSYPLILTLASYTLFSHSNNASYFSHNLRVTYILLSIPLGLLVLVKGSILVLCISMGLLNILFLIGHQRKDLAAIFTLTPLLSMTILWLIAGQSVTKLPTYIKSIFLIASGYSDAMSLYGPLWEIWLYLIASVILIGFVYRLASPEFKSKLIIVVALGVFLFISFKIGFVRHDSAHTIRSASSFLLAAFLVTYLFEKKMLPATLLMLMFFSIHIGGDERRSLPSGILQNFKSIYLSSVSSLANRLFHPDFLNARFVGSLQQLNKMSRFPTLSGSADIYSYDISLLLASQSSWAPRPILQSYAAFTPTLLQANRAHLVKAGAPDNIFFNMYPIDGRFPAMEDGLSWPELLSRYLPTQLLGDYLVLKKNPSATPEHDPAIPLNSQDWVTAQIGQEVRLAKGNAAQWISIDIQPNFLGKLRNVLYKLPHLYIHIKLKNGSERRFRLVSGIAKSGFLLSPLVEDTTEFSLLYGDEKYLEDKQVESFTLTIDGGDAFWPDSYSIAISPFTANMSNSPTKTIDVLSLYSFNNVLSLTPQDFTDSSECVGRIDTINKSPLTPKNRDFSGTMRVFGWLVSDLDKGILADTVYVTLKNTAHNVSLAATLRALRPDVVQRSGKESLYFSGFYSFIDISKLSGNYTVGLAYKKEHKLFRCNNLDLNIVIR